MPHITLLPDVPGIRALLSYRPETAKPLSELAEVLLRGPSTLTRAERELIAAYVSHRNECHFCQASHSAIAAEHLGGREQDYATVEQVKADPGAAPISEKLRALLVIAARVQADGKRVTPADVARAREAGATDLEIHDTVLIAAAFCMFNRYVDGLGTWQPDAPEMYREFGRINAAQGYVNRKFDIPYRP